MPSHINTLERVIQRGVQEISENMFQDAEYSQYVYGGCALFALLLLLKALYDFCRILFVPLIIIFVLYGIFVHADRLIKQQVINRSTQRNQALKMELVYIFVSVLGVHYMFGDTMYNFRSTLDFILLKKFSSSPNFIDVVWLLIRCDITIKLLAVSTKLLIVLLPNSALEFEKRGSLYYFVEHGLLLLKCVVSTQPWLYYFYQSYSGFETLLTLIMCLCYLVFKLPGMVLNIKHFLSAVAILLQLIQNVDVGGNIGVNEDCPICCSNFTTPFTLRCRHTFCKNCFMQWYSNNKTCPVCRDKVNYVINNYYYDNGGTSYFVQII